MITPTHEILRNGTRERHERLDQGLALARPDADGPVYVAYLQALRGWLAPLEANLWRQGWPDELAAARRAGKVRWLDQDLAAAGATPTDALCATLPALDAPDAYALGVAYVIEGSQLGGRFLARQLAERMPGHPLHYLNGYGADLGPLWKGFLQYLDTQVQSPTEREQAVAGARDAFDTLTDWMRRNGALQADAA
ncbi:MAG: biliverdin-producing heme oxygenase [Bordetella sp.]|nr:biliverdin-producing heme oxygenase [Bordetella sp.]